MATDDGAARKARADALRRRIDKLNDAGPAAGRAPAPAGRVPPAPAVPESPAEFVHRRMRELGDAPPAPVGRSGRAAKKKGPG